MTERAPEVSISDMPALPQRASRRVGKRRSALADEFLESYVCWREASEDVRNAYRRWADCQPQERGLGFATYRAALEREERAASIHSEWAERLGAFARAG
jgi:hypothetical protein